MELLETCFICFNKFVTVVQVQLLLYYRNFNSSLCVGNLTTCHPSVTKEMVPGQSMSVKWSKTCQASHFDGYVVSYVTRIDYRQVYVNITQHSFVFRGMVAAPQKVSVVAVPMAVQKTSDIATVNTDAPKSADQLSNNGLLISVIILSILFVISGLMAIYLCCYLRM